jgi:hypothetical protein
MVAMNEACEPYENTLSIDELRKEVRRSWDREHALLDAIRDWPELPPVKVMDILSHAGKWPADWERGKELQRKHGLDAVPPRTEYELGLGVWSRMRDALMSR